MISVTFNLNNQNEVEVPFVSFQPTDTRWDDFGYNYHAIVRISTHVGGPTLDLRALVAPIKNFDGETISLHSNLYDWLLEELSDSGKKWIQVEQISENSDFPKFVTLLQGETAYRKLAEFVRDQKERVEILTKMNDLVFSQGSEGLHKNFFNLLSATEEFKFGIMRTGSAFRALHRGWRYIWGEFNPPAITDTRCAFNFQCPLKGFQKNPHTRDSF